MTHAWPYGCAGREVALGVKWWCWDRALYQPDSAIAALECDKDGLLSAEMKRPALVLPLYLHLDHGSKGEGGRRAGAEQVLERAGAGA